MEGHVVDTAAALALAKAPPDELEILTAAMVALGKRIAIATDAEKDRRTEAYRALRDHAVLLYPNTSAEFTDPWMWKG